MVNFPLIYKIIGSLLFLLGTMLAICVAISLCYGEDDMLPFLTATLLTVSAGFVFNFLTACMCYLGTNSTCVYFKTYSFLCA